jgi:glycerophosphoryl diester phosphodiesterase
MASPLILAHRGAREAAPENTLAAFALARSMGADGVELDVHRTTDGELAIDHDGRLDGLGAVTDHDFARVRRHAPSVPTLQEALAECGDALVNIEIKNLPGDPGWDPTHAIADVVVAYLARVGRVADVIVSSFNLETVDRVHALAPDLPTGFLTIASFDPFDALVLAHDRGHVALHPQAPALAGDVARALCDDAHARGMRIHTWTVNDPVEMQRLADAGVDAIITDVPDVAVMALRR